MSHPRDSFYVGQRVRIRDWDDMESEFEESELGGFTRIRMPLYVFLDRMRPLCGATAEIITMKTVETEDINVVTLEHWETANGKPTTDIELAEHTWMYTTSMIEPVDEEELTFDRDLFCQMIGVKK